MVEDYLKEVVPARERKNRSRAVWRMLQMLHPEVEKITLETFHQYYSDIMCITRYINAVQKDDKSLRGTDYEDGKELAAEMQLELGYEPGHFQRSKKLNKLI